MSRTPRQYLDELLCLGGQMANICFNLNSRCRTGTEPLTVRDLEVMKECQLAWDAALIGYTAATKQKPRKRKTRTAA